MKQRLGYIGLGQMGKPIAANLLQAGFSHAVHNRSRKPMQDLVSVGAKATNSPKKIAELSDLVFTCLPDTDNVLQVVLGQDGVTPVWWTVEGYLNQAA